MKIKTTKYSRKNSRKHSGKHSGKQTKGRNFKKRKSNLEQIDIDYTDPSITDFRQKKSISVATTESDVKSSKIGELYDVKPIHDNIQRLCQLKLHGRSFREEGKSLPKSVNKDICECLFQKNRSLRIIELENIINKQQETPASSCIKILDNYRKKVNSKSSKHYSKYSSKHSSKQSSKHSSKHSSKQSSKHSSKHSSNKQ